jgi:hypothetical protein
MTTTMIDATLSMSGSAACTSLHGDRRTDGRTMQPTGHRTNGHTVLRSTGHRPSRHTAESRLHANSARLSPASATHQEPASRHSVADGLNTDRRPTRPRRHILDRSLAIPSLSA